MREIRVTPETAQAALEKAAAGDVFIFSPGRYSEPLKLSGKHGTVDEPIILRGEPGAILTAHTKEKDYNFEEYRLAANKIAKGAQNDGEYPTVYRTIKNARLSITDSSHISIEGLEFKQSWPTHIYLDQSQSIQIRNVSMQDGTYAIHATGASTRGITLENVSWQQDVSGKIWKGIDWLSIHGNGDGVPLVNVEKDYRLFDGDFFSANSIAGDVTIKNCNVSDAFNAIHFRNPPNSFFTKYSTNLVVSGCHFTNIRDNVIEPENSLVNWKVFDNHFTNTFKPIALESSEDGVYQNLFIYNNHFKNDGKPGPVGDDHTGSAIFKFDNANSSSPFLLSNVVFENNDVSGIKLFKDKAPIGLHIKEGSSPLMALLEQYFPTITAVQPYFTSHPSTPLAFHKPKSELSIT